MGHYYNPPQPNIGNKQPLQQALLDPPQSGPLAQNPPFAGSIIGAAVLACWAAAVTISGITPVVAHNLNPPISGPVQTNLPVGSVVPRSVLAWWSVPTPAPITAINLSPPVSGPIASNPPVSGAAISPQILSSWQIAAPAPIRAPVFVIQSASASSSLQPATSLIPVLIPDQAAPSVARNLNPAILSSVVVNSPLALAISPAILSSWQIAAPAPIAAIRSVPPISGPIAQNPPFAPLGQPIFAGWNIAAAVVDLPLGTAPQPVAASPSFVFNFAIYRAWDASPPAPIVARNLNPPIGGVVSNPPFSGGAKISGQVLIGWLPPAPAPITGPKFTAGASGSQNPPFMGGARIPLQVPIAWLPPVPLPIVGPKFTKSGVNIDFATLSVTENIDTASFALSFSRWSKSGIQSEIWTTQIKQAETWTPATIQPETWTKE